MQRAGAVGRCCHMEADGAQRTREEGREREIRARGGGLLSSLLNASDEGGLMRWTIAASLHTVPFS